MILVMFKFGIVDCNRRGDLVTDLAGTFRCSLYGTVVFVASMVDPAE